MILNFFGQNNQSLNRKGKLKIEKSIKLKVQSSKP